MAGGVFVISGSGFASMKAADACTGMTVDATGLIITTNGGGSSVCIVRADVPGRSSGKYYFEATWTAKHTEASSQEVNYQVGIIDDTIFDGGTTIASALNTHGVAARYDWQTNNGGRVVFSVQYTPVLNGYSQINPAGSTVETAINGQTVGVRVDLDTLSIDWYEPFAAAVVGPGAEAPFPAGQYKPAICMQSGTTGTMTLNFGQSAFVHGLPGGYTYWPGTGN